MNDKDQRENRSRAIVNLEIAKELEINQRQNGAKYVKGAVRSYKLVKS